VASARGDDGTVNEAVGGRDEAGQDDGSSPPRGAQLRIGGRVSLPVSQCSPTGKTVIITMKTYGLILADNGSNWHFWGTADTRGEDPAVDQLKPIPASALVALDESCFMVLADSGQAYLPGTTGYANACGGA